MSSSNTPTPRFTAQSATAEDVLKNQTVGLVHLDEFRKRRRDLEELKAQNAQEESDGTLTPGSHEGSPAPTFQKKKRKIIGRGLLSFADDEDGDQDSRMSGSAIKHDKSSASESIGLPKDKVATDHVKRKLTPNPNATLPAPKIMTKASLAAEATERERLRKEFVLMQEKVRATEISIPFVFYDGSNIPGGTVHMKKGDHIWLLLERCRKVGAEMGVGGDGPDATGMRAKVDGRKSWARIGVDDLICLRGGVIVPHHYELYYFIANQVADPTDSKKLLFDFSGTASIDQEAQDTAPLLRKPKDEQLEGHDHDPRYTKIVDRRWYEKNKHIYPASLWKEYKAGAEFEQLAKGRTDALGNSFFYTRG